MIQSFIECLRKDEIPWHRSWSAAERPINAVTGVAYHGANAMWLSYNQAMQKTDDPRWCTFKQAQAKGWKIKPGSKGTKVEFWSLYDTAEKKKITQKEAKILSDEISLEEFKERIKPISSTYTVFNGEQIEGIPLHEVKTYNLNKDELMKKRDVLIKNMALSFEEGGDSAYYNPQSDSITLPQINYFESEYAYMATLLHEAGHATGHESRLNRDLSGAFGSPEYAKEELRAEIASAFTAQTLGIDYEQNKYMENHEAYVQNWIKVLENEPGELFSAIKDAEKIADYLIDKGEFTEDLNKSIENEQEQIVRDAEVTVSGAQAARFRMAMKGQEKALEVFLADDKLDEHVKQDSLNIGKEVAKYMEEGLSVSEIIMTKTQEIDASCNLSNPAYTKKLIAGLYAKTNEEYKNLKELPNLWDEREMTEISEGLAEQLVYNHVPVVSGKETLEQIENPRVFQKFKGLKFFANETALSNALKNVPGINAVRCEYSETESFEKGKTYTAREYDYVSRETDREYNKGHDYLIQRYKTQENIENIKNPEEQKYIKPKENKFTAILKGEEHSGEMTFGEGKGGFNSQVSHMPYSEEIQDAINKDEQFRNFADKIKDVYEFENSKSIPNEFRTTTENMEVINRDMLLTQHELIKDMHQEARMATPEKNVMSYFKNSGIKNTKARAKGMNRRMEMEL